MNTQLLKLVFAVVIALIVNLSASVSRAESLKAVEAKALAGDPKAQFELAKMYEHGRAGGKPDFASALSWYEEAARNGLKVASYRIKMLNQP